VLCRCLVARDAFALAQASTAAALLDVLFDQRLAAVLGNPQDIILSEGAAQATGLGKLEEWGAVFFTCSVSSAHWPLMLVIASRHTDG